MNKAPMANWRARLRTISQTSRIPLEVHFASDMQKSSMPPAFADLRLGSDTKLVFHSVADSQDPNWMVESVTAPAKIYDPKKVRVQAVVAGSNTPATKRTVSLALDGKVLESKSVDVPANGRASVEFVSLDSPHGFHKGEIRIEPRRFAARRRQVRFRHRTNRPAPVLFLHPAGQDRDELYYRSALESVSEAGFTLEPLAVEQAGNQSLSKYAFVVLSDVGRCLPGLENNLRAYVAGGGSLLIALGPIVGRAQPRSGLERNHPGIRATRRRGTRALKPWRRPTPSIPRCAAPTSWTASSFIR